MTRNSMSHQAAAEFIRPLNAFFRGSTAWKSHKNGPWCS